MEPILKDIRFKRINAPSLRSWGEPPAGPDALVGDNVVVECGWGRLIFAHTFKNPADVARILREEQPDQRDIALYLRDPHVVLAAAPQELFLDPSHTYRLWLSQWRPMSTSSKGFTIRRLCARADAEEINRLYGLRHMVPVEPEFVWRHRTSRVLTYLVAVDNHTNAVIGTVTGVDHAEAFSDPENGSSLWALAVDPQAAHPGVGSALVNHLAGHYLGRGRAFMDLSVLHTNKEAIALYEKLGFRRVPVFCIKHKNPVNEPLFIGPSPEEELNPYARLIVDEARRRGIAVDVIDAEYGYFALNFGGRTIHCRESLTELTSAVALWRCDDKVVTHRCLARAGLRVPRQQASGSPEENAAFLERCGRVVVKPARGEQGVGITCNVTTLEALHDAIDLAATMCPDVLLEEHVEGDDLRILVIDGRVVAAALRQPPEVVGTGNHTVEELVERLSRRRSAQTDGEAEIPVDDVTRGVVEAAGHRMDEVLPAGARLRVRDTANLHTGGTLHDVTEDLHPQLVRIGVRAAEALEIPVVGVDLLVDDPSDPSHPVVVEANERPGLANHEPHPTAAAFLDLLFPSTAVEPHRATTVHDREVPGAD